MAHLVDIYLQPGKVFVDLRENPKFALPLLLIVVLSAALPLWYFMSVDGGWYTQHVLLAGGAEMSAGDLEKARAMMPGATTMAYIGAASSAVTIAVIFALYALYLMLAGKVTGGAMTFKRGYSLATWSSMPMVLGSLVALAGVAMMSPQTPLESLMLTNVDPLLVHLPTDSHWSTLARSFSLLNFWSWFLLALGWRVFNRANWTQSALVALLPSVVIYGGMALYAMLK
ncbi:MAG: YIP1 family protein [Luteimonas sp.]